jgi:hypothetical protein
MLIDAPFITMFARCSGRSVASVVAQLRADGADVVLRSGVDTSWRGSGNRAARRAGSFESYDGCGCVVCVEYGGDCANVLRGEWLREEHCARRGVKTRHFNALPKSPDERKGAAYQTLFGNS